MIDPSKIPMVDLRDHVSIVCGPAFASDQFTDDPSDVPLVKGENLHQGFIDWGKAKRWPRVSAPDYKKYELRPQDVVVAMDRPWVTAGLKWSYIREHDPSSLLVQRVARLRAQKSLDQLYLRCLISSDYFSAYIQPIVTGVNVPHISAKQIGKFRIPLPGKDVQQKIAAILTAYDDLIENNRQRISLLENMAEEIYREWFVRLRFPGHEHTRVDKGVPEGWEPVRIGDMYRTAAGGTPSRSESRYFGGEIPWVKTGELKQAFVFGTEELITEDAISNSAAKRLPPGTVVMAMYCAMEDVTILGAEAATNQACCALLPREAHIGPEFTYQQIRLAIREMTNWSHGAAQQNLSQTLIRAFPVFNPGKYLIEQYCEIARPKFELIKQLMKSTANLSSTRDLLLNRLISGKLRVDDLDIEFPPSMQEKAA